MRDMWSSSTTTSSPPTSPTTPVDLMISSSNQRGKDMTMERPTSTTPSTSSTPSPNKMSKRTPSPSDSNHRLHNNNRHHSNDTLSKIKFSIDNILSPSFGKTTSALLSTFGYHHPLHHRLDIDGRRSSHSTSSITSSSSSSSSSSPTLVPATLPPLPNGGKKKDNKHSATTKKEKDKTPSSPTAASSATTSSSSSTTTSSEYPNNDDHDFETSKKSNDSRDPNRDPSLVYPLDGKQPIVWPAWVYCTRYSDRPSSGGNRRPRSRRTKKPKEKKDEKRPRTAFTADQLARLKQEFQENRYLTEKRRQDLARDLNLNESQIKIWFQNKRAKIKKTTGQKNPLALHLMAQGLYNHTTAPPEDGEEEEEEESQSEDIKKKEKKNTSSGKLSVPTSLNGGGDTSSRDGSITSDGADTSVNGHLSRKGSISGAGVGSHSTDDNNSDVDMDDIDDDKSSSSTVTSTTAPTGRHTHVSFGSNFLLPPHHQTSSLRSFAQFALAGTAIWRP